MWELNKHIETITLIYKNQLILKNKIFFIKSGQITVKKKK
jgi:hypothetical protein